MRNCRNFFLIFSIFLFFNCYAQQRAPRQTTRTTTPTTASQTSSGNAGKVLASTGTVTANQRTLSRGSIVSAGDTIVVGANSRVQILLNDGTMLNLTQNSRYQINTFNYSATTTTAKTKTKAKTQAQKTKAKPSFLARLFTGGLQKLTGKIAEQNPDGHQETSRVATIGIRGTLFETAVDQTEQNQALGVYQGTTTFRNQTSGTSVNVGDQGTQRFASADTAGRTLPLPQPPNLLIDTFEPQRRDLLRDVREIKRRTFELEESASVSGSYPSNQGPDAVPFQLSDTTIEASTTPPGGEIPL